YLETTEGYSGQWRLEAANQQANTWWPFSHVSQVSSQDHLEINGSFNGWFVDPKQFCQAAANCRQNADGSYDMDMVMEFAPQRWFVLGVAISGMTFAGAIAFLIYSHIRHRNLWSVRWKR
ncbi:MAG TPA: hypothetical protein VNG90_01215, partial [Candidatus Acidoferrum sp.]|nr:hypothetical protein [Candidatus Acidoferrum sp.]